MTLTNADIVAIVDEEFESSLGAPGGVISNERAKALRYHNSEPFGNEVEDRSQQVTADVMEVVDGIMPSLLRIFAEKDNLVDFMPVGLEDEALAQQETEYTSHVLFKNEDWFMSFYSWFWDALVQKNGILKAWHDESERTTTESYANLDEDELYKLLSDPELTPIEKDEREDVTIVDGAEVRTTLYDITFERTTKKPILRLEPVPPEEYRISSDSTSVNPSKARMVGQERKVRRHELIEMGFDKDLVMSLPAEGSTDESDEETARRGGEDVPTTAAQKANEEVELREAYIRLDVRGNGKSQLYQVFVSNNHVLEKTPIDRQPFHILSSKPLPHKHFGTCVAELVMDIQLVASTLLRQTLDNLYQSNNPGHAVYSMALGDSTMDDLLTTEIGGVTVFERPINESYAPMTVPFMARESFSMLDFFDKQKRDRTGVSSDSEGLTPEALKHIQSSVLTAAVDMSKMKIEMIARIFSETGIKSLMMHIHELIRKNPDKVETFKLRGEWVPVDPSSWRDRTDVKVTVGLGIGSRESNLIHLNAIKDYQSSMIAAGYSNLLVSPQNLYNTASEIVKNANLREPLKYFSDPGQATAPPTSQEQLQLQQQAALLQQQAAQLEQRARDLDKTELNHTRDMLKIQQDESQHKDKLRQDQIQHNDKIAVALEKLQNDIAEMQMKYDNTPDELTFDGVRFR